MITFYVELNETKVTITRDEKIKKKHDIYYDGIYYTISKSKSYNDYKPIIDKYCTSEYKTGGLTLGDGHRIEPESDYDSDSEPEPEPEAEPEPEPKFESDLYILFNIVEIDKAKNSLSSHNHPFYKKRYL